MVNEQYIEKYFEKAHEIINMFDKSEINKVIEMFFDAWKNNNTIFFMGNGGSASNATHFTADLAKTTMIKGKKRFKAISLTDCIPLISAWTNDEGWGNVYKGQLENLLNPKDIVVGLSVHGGSGEGNAGNWSENLTAAFYYAKEMGAKTIGFSGFDGGVMKKICDACIVVKANSTPQVESFHSVLQHLIIFRLKEKIRDYEKGE
jgi:D-sedoheptulose 7-phosphate isomerase